MNRWFRALPIHRKLTVLALGVSAAALVAALLGLAVYDLARYRTAALSDTRATAQLIAENTAATIVFDDAEAARATLSSVGVRPTVISACIYRADGSVLASYTRAGARSCADAAAGPPAWGVLASRVPVMRNGREVGAVLVERDLSDLRGRLLATASTGALMLVVGGLTALGLAGALQRLVSRPIIALVQAARAVGHGPRYELPEIDAPPDETGELVHAFGDMVRRVDETNAALVESNTALRGEVDQRRRMEEEREALLAREREASRLKDEFLAAVSHELRTPLNAILGWTQILQTTKPGEETVQRAIASLARNAQAQSRVIEDLLDISRIITGKLRLSIGPLDLRQVIDAALDVVEPLALSRQITLVRTMPDDECLVQGDYDRLRQVIWNLLSNALKFTPAGGRVEVRLSDEGNTWALAVADTGVGISRAFIAHAFERFRQADGSSTREQGGLGLGLAIVKELTELHGGTVSAESAGPGRGSTFIVRLPSTNVPRTASVRALPDARPVPRLDGIRVMVVDDNTDALELLGHALARAGADVRLESSGTAALQHWMQDAPDVLLCDLAMPGMDGFEVLRRAQALDTAAGRQTHALAVTAYASEDHRVRCLRAGFVGHIPKPYDLGDVIRAIASAAAQN